ncbi:MAG: hypothetical protein PSX80_05290 [bacterium]|nr:hypothetical protein [bacterium]
MKIGLPLLLSLLLSIESTAQGPDPKLVDEFGNVHCEGLIGRLDLFLAELSNSKDGSGLVVLYEGKYINYTSQRSYLVAPVFGEVNIRANLIRNHFKGRGFDPSRITFASGGFRDEHLVELWVIPPGGTYPKPKPTRDKIEYRKGKPSTVLPSCP